MLEKVDLTKKISKEEYKAKMPQMEIELGRLQRECRELKIPVMIVFEGFGASGKGVQIGKLIQSMDPRGFQVFPIKAETEDERMHPFLWRFWTKTPEAGRIAIFDGSWYRKVLIDRFEKRTREKEIETAFHSIEAFEKQLTDGGTILVKLLLDIDQKEQKKRFEKLLEKKETAWRVSQGDRERNAKYSEYAAMMEEVLYRSDTKSAPWTVIEATDRRFATVKIYMTVIHALAEAVEAVQRRRMEEQAIKAAEQVSGQQEAAEIMRQAGGELEMLQSSVLSRADLTLAYGKEEYEKAVNLADHLFNNKFNDLSKKDIEDLFQNADIKDIETGKNVVDILVDLGAVSSKREAREFIGNGAISINGDKITNTDVIVNQDLFIEGKYLVVKRGKKNYYVGKIK